MLRSLAALIPALVIAGAYLLGAVPFGLLLARRFAGIDVRDRGSGNIGATNVARSAGRLLGAITLALDAGKGALPVLVAGWLSLESWAAALAGLAAVTGHVFPIYLRFRGGKGVATAAGAFLVLSLVPMLIAMACFGSVALITRHVSLGSLAGATSLMAAVVWLDPRPELLLVAAVVLVLIFARHIGNLQALFGKPENRS